MDESIEFRRLGIRAVRSKDTKPEMQIRRMLHARGYRYRLHKRDLPGSPDLTFPARKKVIFVNGCFWHGHSCKNGNRAPKNNQSYWLPKIVRNVERDNANLKKLANLGWEALTVWECEITNDHARLRDRLIRFLG